MLGLTAALSTEGWIADQLRRRILNRDVVPGDKLQQADIAREFNVSTTPVREALRTLSAEGLVAIDTNKGARIRQLQADELIEVLELQMLVEIAAAPAAAARIDDEALEHAASLHQAIADSDSPTDFSLLNRDFHCALVIPSGRSRSVKMLHQLFNIGMIQLREDIESWPGRRTQGVADHQEMLDAMRARDAESYQRAVRRHVEAAIGHLRAITVDDSSVPPH